MDNWQKVYQKWAASEVLEDSLRSELNQLKENQPALEDAFYKELTFGTGGMRGLLGAGTNRMNIYSIRKATAGLADDLFESRVNVEDRGVCIAYDSRYRSKEFAIEAAKVLGKYGITAYVFDSIRPTPLLSFAVRYMSAAAGIMVTASHNPPEYNGFKVYNENGGQIVPSEAASITAHIAEIENELTVPVMNREELEENNLLVWMGENVDAAYLEQLKGITKMDTHQQNEAKELKIVFTPLHGTAYQLLPRALRELQFNNVAVVSEQAKPDPEFSTVTSPNPEEHQAFSMAIEQGEEINADILLGTDPDADRLGVAVKNSSGDYQVLTGNQLGALMLDYILSHTNSQIRPTARALKTVVTTELARIIADSYGVKTIDTLTGFKYIADKIRQFDETGETFIFGFEESYGYLISGFTRDKDALQAAVMACEIAHYWKRQGKTLFEALYELYARHGYYLEDMDAYKFEGKEGSDKIAGMMEHVRTSPISEIAGLRVEQTEDYLTGERYYDREVHKEKIELPNENMVKFILEQDSWICLRPSGTEPKIKCYYGVRGSTEQHASDILAALKKQMKEKIQKII